MKGIEVTAQGKRDQDYLRIVDRMDAREKPYYWLGFNRQLSVPEKGTDIWALRENLFLSRRYASISPMSKHAVS